MAIILQVETTGHQHGMGGQVAIDSVDIIAGQKPTEIVKRAVQEAKRSVKDVVIFDTAGRLHTDEQLMQELQSVRDLAQPLETLLVVDIMSGQDVIKNSEVFVNDLFDQLGAEPKSSAELAKYELALKQEATKRKETFVTPSEKDWCIYIDTDSLYFSSLPLRHKLKGDLQEATIKLSRFVEQKLNKYYDN